ncbi:hypothetical protein LOCC1_G005029, partial [Lachnellula occidentalis]
MTSKSDEARALQPPFIPIDGLSNFRDIGGWPIQNSLSLLLPLRHKPIFRTTHNKNPHRYPLPRPRSNTPHPHRYSPAESPAHNHNIRPPQHATDLPRRRHKTSRWHTPGLVPRIRRGGVYAREGRDEGIVTAFLSILAHGALPAFRPILLHLAATPAPEPCLVHCTTGNNRSGVFTGILLSLLGVSAEVVAREYALSEVGLRGGRDAVVERLLGNPRFREVVGGREEA